MTRYGIAWHGMAWSACGCDMILTYQPSSFEWCERDQTQAGIREIGERASLPSWLVAQALVNQASQASQWLVSIDPAWYSGSILSVYTLRIYSRAASASVKGVDACAIMLQCCSSPASCASYTVDLDE